MRRLNRALDESEKRDHFETKTGYLCGLNEPFLSTVALKKRYRHKCIINSSFLYSVMSFLTNLLCSLVTWFLLLRVVLLHTVIM